MTLRHIVSWKLSGDTRDARDTQAAEIIAALEALPALVPTLNALTAHRNELFDGDNYDVTLIADFDDEAGLAAYVVHPDHVVAGAVIGRHAIARVATDFTL